MATLTHKGASYFGMQSTLNGKSERKIGHNTYVVQLDEFTIAVRYHYTFVVTFYRDGRIGLNSGGWETSTTKDRINQMLPMRWGVQQEKHVWYLVDRDNDYHSVPFYDGMMIPA